MSKSIQLVHLSNVLPKVFHRLRDFVTDKKLSGNPDVLKFGHQLAVKAAQGVSYMKKITFPKS